MGTALAEPVVVVPEVVTPPAAVAPPVAEPAVVVPPVEPPAPVDYKLSLPKDSTLDPAVLERTVAIARARGLSPEQAQAAVDLVHAESATHSAAVLAAHQPGGAAWTKQLDAWKAETLADPSLGKTPEERLQTVQRAGLVLAKFKEANPDMGGAVETFLTTSGIGERREVMHLLSWIGKASGERPMALPSDSAVRSPEATLDALYPSMKKS